MTEITPVVVNPASNDIYTIRPLNAKGPDGELQETVFSYYLAYSFRGNPGDARVGKVYREEDGTLVLDGWIGYDIDNLQSKNAENSDGERRFRIENSKSLDFDTESEAEEKAGGVPDIVEIINSEDVVFDAGNGPNTVRVEGSTNISTDIGSGPNIVDYHNVKDGGIYMGSDSDAINGEPHKVTLNNTSSLWISSRGPIPLYLDSDEGELNTVVVNDSHYNNLNFQGSTNLGLFINEEGYTNSEISITDIPPGRKVETIELESGALLIRDREKTPESTE